MLRAFLFGLALLAASAVAAQAASDTLWLHVKVDEKQEDGDRVRINLPIRMVEKVLPAIHSRDVDGGMIRIEGHDMKDADVRAILEAARDAEDGEYVTVDNRDEKVRVTKKGEHIFINVKDRTDHPEDVEIRMPVKVLTALLSGGRDELNLLAAIRELSRSGEQELVTVSSEEENVRIWVDSRNTDGGPEDSGEVRTWSDGRSEQERAKTK